MVPPLLSALSFTPSSSARSSCGDPDLETGGDAVIQLALTCVLGHRAKARLRASLRHGRLEWFRPA